MAQKEKEFVYVVERITYDPNDHVETKKLEKAFLGVRNAFYYVGKQVKSNTNTTTGTKIKKDADGFVDLCGVKTKFVIMKVELA